MAPDLLENATPAEPDPRGHKVRLWCHRYNTGELVRMRLYDNAAQCEAYRKTLYDSTGQGWKAIRKDGPPPAEQVRQEKVHTDRLSREAVERWQAAAGGDDRGVRSSHTRAPADSGHRDRRDRAIVIARIGDREELARQRSVETQPALEGA